jgi:anti-sigma B factor antagonist
VERIVVLEEELKLEAEDREEVRIFRLTGRCTVDNCQRVKDAVHKSVEEKKERVIFDLSGCDFMDSAGLGSLVACRFACAKERGALILCNVSTRVLGAIRLARLDRILPIHRTLEGAVLAAQEPEVLP